MLVDSHCHLDFDALQADIDGVMQRAKEAGVERMVTISTRVKKFDTIKAIAEKYPHVFCSVGTHPHNADEELDISVEQLVELSAYEKCVAIGEAGLDYFYDNAPREAQEIGFRRHIEAARITQLPLVIHTRDAEADTARILSEETEKGAFPFVLHCFSSGEDLALHGIELGRLCVVLRDCHLQIRSSIVETAKKTAVRPNFGGNGRALSGASATPWQVK